MTADPRQWLYTAQQSRDVDRCAIAEHGLPGPQLMARAARSAFDELLIAWPEVSSVLVLCGPGNNGGDGLLLAILAQGRGLSVRVVLIDGEPRSDDAVQAAARARGAGLALETVSVEDAVGALAPGAVVVDAMLGTGISGVLRPAYAAAVAAVNAGGVPVLALDVPTGLNSDSGAVCGSAVRARRTVSFITAKRGLFTGDGPDYAGERRLATLDVPAAAYAAAAGPRCERLCLDRERAKLPVRRTAAHKGDYGRCLLVGGDAGMGGAVILAAEAALRCGAGLLRVATRPEHLAALLARRPEAMATAVEHYNDLLPLLEWATVIAIGPGLGQGPWSQQMLHAALRAGKPLVIDADALNLLAVSGAALPPSTVITPHPGEAARLLGTSTETIRQDRFAAVAQLWSRGAESVVLKGAGSLVAGTGGTALCEAGNPGMASGGTGDVLTGVIAGLLAQGLSCEDAARLGVVLHGTAADSAAEHWGEPALLAGDLLEPLAALLR